MRITIVIPARYESTRFPGKPFARLKGAGGSERSLIARTVDAALAVGPSIDVENGGAKLDHGGGGEVLLRAA
ncbi:cytidylyltransferase domain-containing protein [Sphingobium sp. CFD-2]|uniref:cytidylyltransferase domain-containing protein n=1 Tax=Sphingobium sp. CFD-2 TaxID=2878542 RepID=UPI00214D0316|nr:hypothetical protein [Sphingobium sp. CFD-2]